MKTLCKNLKLKYQIIKQNDTIEDKKEIIIINYFGVLIEFFKYAKSVFIGKSTLKN